MPRLRGPQSRVFVPIIRGITLKYGYKMNTAQFNSIGGVLGIADAVAEPGVFYGANSPKPGRARLITASGSQSSYYDMAKAKTLAKAGWQLEGSPRSTAIKTSGKSVTVAVDTPHGYQYAWNITNADKDLAIALGAEIPTNSNLLVWGSFPKPPKATKRDADGTKSTFCPPTQAAIEAANQAGWAVEGLDGDWLN